MFDDWIIRISPATFKQARRIIAEDLAANDGSDFDYNDVVFDATLTNDWIAAENANKLVAHITLQAAGGTMPLYVGGKEKGREVHGLFGVSTDVMVNTGAGPTKAPVQFDLILGDADWSGTYNIKNIPVVVVTKNGDITLGVETGMAPEKIAVTTDYVWTIERQAIHSLYPLFPEWVKNKSVVWY